MITVLKEIRVKKGLSQAELSHVVKVHSTAISQIERRKTAAWTRLRREIAKALEMDETVLFEENGLAREG